MPEGTDTAPEVRTANVDDLAPMLAMEARYTENDVSLESFRETFEEYPELFIVCEDEGELVGEASGRVEGETVVLESIAVVDDRQGDGIGKRVLKQFERGARKYADRVSVASTDNVEGFYRALGYEPTEILLQVDPADVSNENRNDDRPMDDDRIVDWREANDTLFFYAEFEEYDPDIRRELKAAFGAFEANTIYEKDLSD